MDPNLTALERAFQIAASGAPRNVNDIRARLKAEGYDYWQVQGRSLSEQLRKIIADARTGEPG